MNLELRDVSLPLSQFTLQVNVVLQGRVTALFGPSGSGKTTILELIAGLREPRTGRITLGEIVLTDSHARHRLTPQQRSIGYVPQEGALFPHLSVRQNLLFGYKPEALRHHGLNFEHVVEVLEMGAWMDQPVGRVSGGERQRAALGRALLSSPRLLLLDEPLAGLDTALKERLMPYLKRIRDEFQIPMIYVTHAAEEVVDLCDEALVLSQGQILRQGAPAVLFSPTEARRYRLNE